MFQFSESGYLIVKNWVEGKTLADIQTVARSEFMRPLPPLELEAQLGYPGAPESVVDEGGSTPRRLLRAYGRSKVWDEHATSRKMHQYLQQLLKHEQIFLSQAHHNCLMTKTSRYSSDTGWHRDSRYWQFEQNELVTAWLALGDEFENNGALKVVPRSHKQALAPHQFDEKSFFISSLEENKAILDDAISLSLSAGDLLFFHCNLLHKASRNNTPDDKLSIVFTYFNGDNKAIPNTRSDSLKSILLDS